jgi:predicted nucleotidyltransferase
MDSNAIQEIIAKLADRYGLDAVYLFGSRADVDVGVLPQRGHRLSVRDKVRLAAALEDLWDVPRVDLVVLPEASPFLALDVIAGPCIYARDTDALAEYELYVLRRAGDLAPFERARRRHILDQASR